MIKHIEAICKNFLWKGNAYTTTKAPVNCDSVYNPRGAKGLNITSLKEWNIAMMGKLFWNILAKDDKLWIKWITTYYMKQHNVLEWQHKNCSWILANIFKCRDKIKKTKAWEDFIQTGRYRTTSIYKGLRRDRGQVEWKHPFHHNHAKPQAKFIMWISMLGRLTTKDMLQ